MNIRLAGFVLLLALSLASGIAGAQDTGGGGDVDFVGSVKTVTGAAYIVHEDVKTPAAVGDHFYEGDSLVTRSSSSIGVIFRDDTILSLGPGSEVAIDEFIFDPAEGNMSFLARMNKGVGQFITGQMAKIAPDNMRVETPLTTIGIRGTRFLVKVD